MRSFRYTATEQDLSLATRFMLSSLEPIKCMPFHENRCPTQFLIPYSIKILKRSSSRKKIKELSLNFFQSEDDYVEVSRLVKLFTILG